MSLTTEKMVEFFNTLLAVDPATLHHLFRLRVGCNPSLAEHPHVLVCQDGEFVGVGIVGLLNGLLSSCGEPLLAMQVAENGALVGFQVYTATKDDQTEA